MMISRTSSVYWLSQSYVQRLENMGGESALSLRACHSTNGLLWPHPHQYRARFNPEHLCRFAAVVVCQRAMPNRLICHGSALFGWANSDFNGGGEVIVEAEGVSLKSHAGG